MDTFKGYHCLRSQLTVTQQPRLNHIVDSLEEAWEEGLIFGVPLAKSKWWGEGWKDGMEREKETISPKLKKTCLAQGGAVVIEVSSSYIHIYIYILGICFFSNIYLYTYIIQRPEKWHVIEIPIEDCAIDIENSSWKPRFSMISRAFTNFLAQTAKLVSSKSPWQAWLSFCGQGCLLLVFEEVAFSQPNVSIIKVVDFHHGKFFLKVNFWWMVSTRGIFLGGDLFATRTKSGEFWIVATLKQQASSSHHEDY